MKGIIYKINQRGAVMAKEIAIVVVLILMILVPTEPVHAADLVGSCTTLLKGSWSSNVCTIPAGITGEVPSGVTLGVALGEMIDVNGTLTINGELSLQGGTLSNDGITNNNGTINNYSPPTAQQYGLKNYGTFNNDGAIQIFENTALYNYGVFINANTKGANINLKGEFNNLYAPPYSGAFTNKAGGLLNITDSGAYIADQFTSSTNYGEIKIDSTNAKIDVYSLINNGTINNLGGSFQAVDLTNSSTGIAYNDGVNANWTCGDSDSSKLDNEGVFTNRYILNINHKCVFTNKSGGTLDNQANTYIGETDGTTPGGTLLNQGSVNNTGKIILMGYGVNSGVRLHNDNGGVITNGTGSVIQLGTSTKMFNTGLIEHRGVIQPGGPGASGTLENYRWESPWQGDPGVINKYCTGSITVPLFGPAPIDMCAGTIVIIKNTEMKLGNDFSFTGSGSLGTFSLDDDYDSTLPNTMTFSGLTLGSYTVTEAEAAGFTLTGLACTSTEGAGDTTTTNLSTRTATIDLDGGETVTCTFTNSIDSCTPPAVTDHPDNIEITYGQNASFSVAGTNYTSVQWQVNSGSGWSNISGATSLTYNLTKPDVSLSGRQYRAVLTSDCTPVATSNEATLVVNQAPVTATAGSYSDTYDGVSHSPSACAVTGAYTGDLSCTNSPATVGPNVGSGTISPAVNGTGLTNYTITSVNGSWSITPAPVTATAGSYGDTYDGVSHSPSACAVTGAYTGDLSCTNSPASVGPNVGSGTISPAVNGTGLTNYTITSVNGSWSITPAPVTATAGSYSDTYDGVSHSPSACGVTGTYTGDLSCTNDPIEVGPDVGSGTISPIVNGTDLTNYTIISVNGPWSITKADPTCAINGYTGVYDGNPHGASGTCTGVQSETLSGLDLGESFTTVPGGTANWSFTDTNGNYKDDSGSVAINITAKHITGSFTADDKVYDGITAATVLTHNLSGVLSGDDVGFVGGTATFSDKNVGTEKIVTLSGASLSGTDAGNYVLDSVTTTTADISARNIYVRPALGQFKIYGDADPTLTYAVDTPGLATGDTFAGMLSRKSGEDVGFYEITTGTLTINDGNSGDNYILWFAPEVDFEIKAIHITGSFTADDKVYDGTTAATVLTRNLIGVLSGDDVNLTGTATFSDKNVGTDKTVTLKGANLSGTDAGNYELDSVATTTADITARNVYVRPVSGQFKVYGNANPTLTYTVDAPGLASGDSFIGALSRYLGEDVGFYEITQGTLAIDDGNSGDNYHLWFAIEVDFEIKPKHITGSFTANDKVYDGKTAATVLTRSLSGALSGDDVSLEGGTAAFSDKNVGTDKIVTLSGASLSGTDAANYVLDSVATTTADIAAADPTCSVNGYTGVYDGNPYGASGSCTGVESETLTVVDLGDAFTNVPGGTAYWTFTDETGNYNNDSGSVDIVITKADPTCSISGYTGVYDGDPHGASGSCTGVKNETLTTLNLGATFTNAPGGTANWTFTDTSGNYNDDSSSAKIVITKATPTCAINGYTGVYDGNPHGGSGSCTGVKGETLTTLDLGAAFADVPGGTADWTFVDTSGNYNDDSGSVKIVISKADPVCAISGYTGVYDGDPHSASGSCTGVKGETLTTLDLGATFTNVPGGTANWTFTDTSGNYNDDSGSVKIVIEKATLTVTAYNKTAQYSDATPPLTFQYGSFQGDDDADDIDSPPMCSTTREIMSPAGDYPITCSGGEDDNYTFSYVEGTFTVTKESAGITYTGDTQVTTAKAKAKARVTFAAALEEQQDGWLGDHLGGQMILFEVFSFGDTSFSTSVASCTATVDQVVNGKGYGSCAIDLSAADPYQVKVSLVTNGYYKADVESVVVLVNDPGTGMANGGGWLIDPNTDSRVSFGFTTKFLKNGRVQGNSLFIYRVTIDLSTIVPDAPVGEREYNWIIKSNAMQGLYIYDCTVKTTSGCKATITGKNTVQAVDRETGVLYSIGGNYQFQVDVIDNQEPGSYGTGPDQYAIRVWDSSGTYYELGNGYDDHGMLISPLDIAAGNIQVKAKK